MPVYRGVPISFDLIKDGVHLSPTLSQKLWNHSPSGFCWGYEGSGPAQLSLALLLDVLGDKERAVRLHQRFKRRVVARLAMDEPWELTTKQIMEHVEALEAELG